MDHEGNVELIPPEELLRRDVERATEELRHADGEQEKSRAAARLRRALLRFDGVSHKRAG